VLNIINDSSGIVIGFAAQPYPPWRLPGWHRASLGVHGDDGRRYVNDSFGGRDFVAPFRRGDVVGIGMKFRAEDAGSGRCKTSVVFNRNGRKEGGWEIDEERDAERDEGVEGLMAEGDLYAAIGVFGGIEAEVVLSRQGWMGGID